MIAGRAGFPKPATGLPHETSRRETITPDMTDDRPRALVIAGQGCAGLTAAVAAAERARERGCRVDITVVDRAPAGRTGGGTRFSPANMRLGSAAAMARDFQAITADPRCDPAYFATLARDARPAVEWLQGLGIAFEEVPYYLAATPRHRPVGGGAALLEGLAQAALREGVRLVCDFEARAIARDASGAITALAGSTAGGAGVTIAADAVVLACGSFAGNAAMLERHLGPGAASLRPISPGTAANTGAGIAIAQALGAALSGDFAGMHAEPVDPRARNPAAVVLVYPYGILVDRTGRRFLDEGAGLVHDTWEEVSRRIHFDTPGGVAYAVFDAGLDDVAGYRRAIRSECPPHTADSLTALARLLDVPADAFAATVAGFNAHVPSHVPGTTAGFDPTRCDGRATGPGLNIAKSNWARRIERPPFRAWPVVCGIAYTFGGVSTTATAEVLGSHGAIAGLYAAGEITGHFHGRAPNAVSILRAVVFGRIAGRAGIDRVATQRW